MPTTDRQVVDALRRAAENLLGRQLSQSEIDDLVRRFNNASGSYRAKSREALRGFTGLNESEIRTKTAASDNTDRIITDLDRTLDDWKPGT